ncbi:MAG: acylneuraminate cytidylyltransferase family protein [Candidatus Yanofskybacteria bacterium]|nr:acylneuraminate cytidylyltransferase family protein [Candidatus Yanofskybacteria bacterium]
MYKNKKILAVITARGGSKGVQRKNIKPLNGHPLISYVINTAKGSKLIDQVIVSTEDKEIAEIAKKYGAMVPFMRPLELASDTAKSLDVLLHAVKYLEQVNKYKADIIVLIQPTTPLSITQDIDDCIKKLVDTRSNSCTTVAEVVERPEYMYSIKNNKAVAYVKNRDPEARRQDLSKLYISNGAAFAVKRNILVNKNMLVDEGNHTAVIMPRERSVDINEPLDFKIIEALLAK